MTTQEPFVQIPVSILLDCNLSAQAVRLYGDLLKYCGEKNYCWPKQKTLAQDLRLTDRYIRTLLKELEMAGLVHIQTRPGTSNRYTLPLKVIHQESEFIPKVFNRNRSSYPLRNNTAAKVYSTNYNHKKGGYPPKKENDAKGTIPGWQKVKGKWIQADQQAGL